MIDERIDNSVWSKYAQVSKHDGQFDTKDHGAIEHFQDGDVLRYQPRLSWNAREYLPRRPVHVAL